MDFTKTLSEIGDLDQGTLASLIIRKKGVTRGPKTDRVVFGDDLVHVLLWTGFHYQSLVERSYRKLDEMWRKGDLVKTVYQELKGQGQDIFSEDILRAIQELNESFLKVLSGKGNDSAGPSKEHSSVWEPFKVEGKLIRGSKVYVGQDESTDNRSTPAKGTIYMDGVKLGEKILDPSPNGPWAPNKKPKTLAKDLIRSWLPIGLYVRYCLDPANLIQVKVGKQAGEYAKRERVPVDPESIRSLFKIA